MMDKINENELKQMKRMIWMKFYAGSLMFLMAADSATVSDCTVCF
jgi:hypothetical protein